MNKQTFLASAKEIKHSELYMTVKCVMFSADVVNLNGVRCSQDFLDSIVDHSDDYVGLPLCADVNALEHGNYGKLTHMYDANEDKFHTQIIGSFYSFEKETAPSGDVMLIGYARILKRNTEVCRAIGELFATGKLFFSFEIAVGACRKLEDGTMEIYASADNTLEGMCIVTRPAYPEAEALELCAEHKTEEGEREVSEELEKEVVDETKVVSEEDPVEEHAPEEEVKAEENPAAEEPVEEKPAEEGEPAKEEEPAEEEEPAADEPAAEEEPKAEEPAKEEDPVEAEDPLEKLAKVIKDDIAALQREIAELRQSLAEKKDDDDQPEVITASEKENVFIDSISLPDNGPRFSLLEREEPQTDHFSLLEKY